MTKIIIIEDDAKLAEALQKLLEDNGYTAQAIKDFNNVAQQVLESGAELALLDVNLPNLSGERVLKKIRESSGMPMIMLTSRSTEADEIVSMTYGADDFITKPYSPQVLLLRIEAILARAKHTTQNFTYKNLRLNPAKSTIIHEDQEIILTKNEFAILSYLLKNHGKIVSRANIMDYLWDDDRFVDDNTLTVNITRLRRKLAEIGQKDLIQTRRAQGYILE